MPILILASGWFSCNYFAIIWLYVTQIWQLIFHILRFEVFIWCDLSKRFYSLFKLISRICFGYTLHIFGSLFTMFWRFIDSIPVNWPFFFYHANTSWANLLLGRVQMSTFLLVSLSSTPTFLKDQFCSCLSYKCRACVRRTRYTRSALGALRVVVGLYL